MRVAPKISDHAILGVNCDPIAISVLERRGDDCTHWHIFEFSDSAKNVADLARFNFELMRVVDVLISATATFAEVRTGRLNAMRRAFSKIDNFRVGELFFLADNSCGNSLTVDRERNDRGLAAYARDTLSAESNAL